MNRALRLQILAFTAIRFMLNTLHRMVYPFLPVFARALGVDLGALSYALTARSVLGVFAPLLAALSDTRGRKAGLLIGLVLFTGGVTLVIIWPTYPMFFAALILAFLGKLVYDPTVQAYMGDRVPYAQRGTVIALTEISWSVSFIVGVPLAGFMIGRAGWVSPFWALAVLGLVAIFVIFRIIPDERPEKVQALDLWKNLRLVVGYKPVLIGFAFALLISAANEVITLVFGAWIEDSFGVQVFALGTASAVIGFAELGGEGLVGGLTDRLGKVNSLAIGTFLNILAALALPILGSTLVGVFAGLFLFFITFEFTIVSLLPLMTEIFPPARGTVMAVNFASLSLGRAVGAFLGAQFFAFGIWGSVGASVGFNLICLGALVLLKRNSDL